MHSIRLQISGRWLLIVVCLLVGCGRADQPVGGIELQSVSTDSAALQKLIHLPAQATAVQWVVSNPAGSGSSRVPGPSDLRLEAVLSFTAADLALLRQQATPRPTSQPVRWQESAFEDWYPAAVRQSFTATPDGFELNESLYEASPIFTAGTGMDGSFFITPDDTVFLVLSTS